MPPAEPAAGAHEDRLDRGGSGLSRRATNVARAAIEAVLADEDARGQLVAPPPAAVDRAVSWMALATANGSSNVRFGFSTLAWLLQILPIFVIGVPRRMTHLSLADRVRYLETLETSRFGLLTMLVVAFKVPLAIAAFEEPELLASVGFDRPHLAARRALPIADEARP